MHCRRNPIYWFCLSLSIELDWYYCQLFSDLVVILQSILTFLQFVHFFFSCTSKNFKGLIVGQSIVHIAAIFHKNTLNSRNNGSYVSRFLLLMNRSGLIFIFFEKFYKLFSPSEGRQRLRQSFVWAALFVCSINDFTAIFRLATCFTMFSELSSKLPWILNICMRTLWQQYCWEKDDEHVQYASDQIIVHGEKV